MDNQYLQIQTLLEQRAEINARLNLIPYDGSIEIKDRDGKKYIYIRKRILGHYTSTYVDSYSDELFASISRLLKDRKEYKKQIRKLNNELLKLGYTEQELSSRVLLNIDFARANMKSNIYDQAILEGIATTFPDTETIIENGKVSGMTPTDVQKILNLKHAWEFIMDKDVVASNSNYSILCYIASLVNEGFYTYGGRIRSVPVTIGGTSYIPPLPIEHDVKENINEILNQNIEPIDIAIELCLYCMKTQIFNDGNKRASVIFANHFLISKGAGLLVIPESKVPEFKKMLVIYYENRDNGEILEFMKKYCWKSF
jgi:Fic family protein